MASNTQSWNMPRGGHLPVGYDTANTNPQPAVRFETSAATQQILDRSMSVCSDYLSKLLFGDDLRDYIGTGHALSWWQNIMQYISCSLPIFIIAIPLCLLILWIVVIKITRTISWNIRWARKMIAAGKLEENSNPHKKKLL
jgi:hypothetical protein